MSDLSNYQLIDYRAWILGNSAKDGVNLRRLKAFRGREELIFEKSKPYHDRRNDPGHVEISLVFSNPISQDKGINADRRVFGPAIIMHDNGYEGFVSPEEFTEAMKTKEGERRVRLMHQVTVIKRSYGILNSMGYPPRYTAEILAIQSDHDTRFSNPISDNEKVLEDSDILWRFTIPCNLAHRQNPGKAPKNIWDYVPQNLSFQVENPVRDFLCSPEELFRYFQQEELARPNRFHISRSYDIARLEIANTLFNLFPDKARNILRMDFSSELERVVAFYE